MIIYSFHYESDNIIISRVAELAEKHGVSRAQIALAWVLQKDSISAPIIGSTKISHLEDAVNSLSLSLTTEEINYLEEPYLPHAVVGFR